MQERDEAMGGKLGRALLVVAGLILLTVAVLQAQGEAGYELISWTVDGGGGTSDGGNYALHCTIGQPDAGTSSGGSYILQGGSPHVGFAHGGPYPVYVPLALRQLRTWDPYYEPNDTWQAAYGPLAFDTPYRAYPDDEDDYYLFDLATSRSVIVTVENYQAEGQLVLSRHREGDNPAYIDHDGQGLPTMAVGPHALDAGRYYVRVYTSDDRSLSALYTLTVTLN